MFSIRQSIRPRARAEIRPVVMMASCMPGMPLQNTDNDFVTDFTPIHSLSCSNPSRNPSIQSFIIRSSLRNMRRRIPFLLLLPAICICLAGAAGLSVDGLRQWHARVVRVAAIAHRLLAANLQSCPDQRKSYGFGAVTLRVEIPTDIRKAWAEAFQIQDAPTVTLLVPEGPAARMGMHLGDELVAVNDRPWPVSATERDEFWKTLRMAMAEPVLRLTVRRAGDESILTLVGQTVCAADVLLVDQPGTNAHASSSRIEVEAGLEALLQDDAELAAVIAHEIAHVMLKHAIPEKSLEIAMRSTRAVMEQEADALGIELMLRAGYDPEGAATAIPKLDHANRGPISRMLGLYGAYLPTPERVEFLRGQAAKIREKDQQKDLPSGTGQPGGK